MAKRRVPRHLLPFTDPRFRPLAISDLRQLPEADRERFLRTLHEFTAAELLWTWKKGEGRGAKSPGNARDTIRRLLGLPPRARPKRRTGGPPGRPRKKPEFTAAKIRALKKALGASDASIGLVKGLSRSTIARRKK